jgi:hypothetical protein
MLAALEAHQASFLSEALPSTSALARVAPSKEKVAKSVWEMDMDDFDEDADEDSEDEEDEANEAEGECRAGMGSKTGN